MNVKGGYYVLDRWRVYYTLYVFVCLLDALLR